MNTQRRRRRMGFELEALEGRAAPSHMGAVVEDGPHHNRGGHAEIHALRHGADDAANHDANDDKGGAAEAVHHHKGGADDPAGHEAKHAAGHK